MAQRRRGVVVSLPSGVHAVKHGRKTYYYWHPRRSTGGTESVPLGTDIRDPEFWIKLRKLQGDAGALPANTFMSLIADYKSSPKWQKLRPRTRDHYAHHLSRIEAAWGGMPVEGLTIQGIFALRAKFEVTPVAANHLVSILRTLLDYGLQHGYGATNPAASVKPIEIVDEENAMPWPETAYKIIMETAPEHLRRAVFLGRATGQRRSDLVRFGKKHRRDDGLEFRIGKLRDKPHFIPLTQQQLAEIGAWDCSETGPWIVSPTGNPMTGDHLQASLNRFVAKNKALKDYTLKMHGLRAMAACDRKMLGFENQAIGHNIGMSTAMVERYTRHINKEALARQVRDGLERAASKPVK
jgi:hypothetical protein